MKTIYTALFGNYEELKEPLVITPGWDYICFTDQDIKSDIWMVIKFTHKDNTNVEAARYFKIKNASSYMWDYKCSIWVDASFTINCDLNEFWDKKFKGGITAFRHPIRNCVYKEIATCIKNNRANPESLLRQKSIYINRGLPPAMGLAQTGILLRESTEEVLKFSDFWYSQIRLSTRDQIGLAYADWKMPGVLNLVDGFDYRTSQEFIYKTHYNRRDAATDKVN